MGTTFLLNIIKGNPPYILGLLLGCFFCCAGNLGQAQTFTLIKTIPLDKPGAVATDRLQNIYLADQKNNVYKFDKTGQLAQSYSSPTKGHVASIDAWNMPKVLLFSDDKQQITFLDRFLTPISTARLDDLSNGLVRAATLSADDRIWLVNESDFSLIKLDIQRPDNQSATPLNQILNKSQSDIRFLREYQNNLYLVDQASGIYIFDNLGTFKKKLPVPGLTFIGFKENELYYRQNHELIFLNIYSQQERRLALPPTDALVQVLTQGSFYYLFTEKALHLYQLK